MKALIQGVATGVHLQRNHVTVDIPAIYSPGVMTECGRMDQWVFWELSRFTTREHDRMWTARAFKRLESGERVPLQLEDFDGEVGVEAETLDELLVAIGLGYAFHGHLMTDALAIVAQTDLDCNSVSSEDVRKRPWFFGVDAANEAKRNLSV